MQYRLPIETTSKENFSFRLSDHLGGPVEIKWRRGRSNLVSFWKKRGRWEMDLSDLFLHADSRTVKSLSMYLKDPKPETSRPLKEFASKMNLEVPAKKKRQKSSRRHVHHDLEEILKEVNQEYFQGEHRLQIEWGRPSAKRRGRRSIQLGLYIPEDRLVRIHPALDHSRVPRIVLARVVYHEMLHHVLSEGGRRYEGLGHGAEFRKLERKFTSYVESSRWESEHFRFLSDRNRALLREARAA